MSKRALNFVWWIALAATTALCLYCVSLLETERGSVVVETLETEAGPVTSYTATGAGTGPLVFVAHGFAGSRQMMQYISRDLARAGFSVVAFDFVGHGRNSGRLSKDVSRIEGTTRQLVEQTREVIAATRPMFPSAPNAIGMLGHSMATDIIIRAARQDPRIASIVAISMYSDIVTEAFPMHLLILSGEWEGRLRIVGNRLLAQVDPTAREGQTARAGAVERRAVSIPHTEHVAVLFSEETLRESRDWLRTKLDVPPGTPPAVSGMGPLIAGALVGLGVILCLLTRFLPVQNVTAPRLSAARFGAAVVLPAVTATAVTAISPAGLLGYGGFGALLAFLFVWGSAQLLCILPGSGCFFRKISMSGALYLAAGALIFAVALDRYAAAFLPVGERAMILALLLIGALPFAVADRILAARAAVWQRLIARCAVIAVLGVQMVLVSPDLALLFTVLPVLCLFYLVYGTLAHFVARRTGPVGAGCALAGILAWSIAASTPLFLN